MKRTYAVTVLVDVVFNREHGNMDASFENAVAALWKDPPWLDRTTAGVDDQGRPVCYSMKAKSVSDVKTLKLSVSKSGPTIRAVSTKKGTKR